MRILYIGDVMGAAGLGAVAATLADLKRRYRPDCVAAQGENLTDGRGLSLVDVDRLRQVGVDFITGGNWSAHRPETHQLLADPEVPVIGPANFTPESGPGWKIWNDHPSGPVLFISILGQLVGRHLPPISNPLKAVDQILEKAGFGVNQPPVAIVVNFHGDFSSEKRTIGYYLDGRVSLVVGDHWHIQTADAQVLPKGTAHITDVGMAGSIHSSLGVDLDVVIGRWRDQATLANRLDGRRPWQLNAVLADIGSDGMATSIIPIREIID